MTWSSLRHFSVSERRGSCQMKSKVVAAHFVFLQLGQNCAFHRRVAEIQPAALWSLLSDFERIPWIIQAWFLRSCLKEQIYIGYSLKSAPGFTQTFILSMWNIIMHEAGLVSFSYEPAMKSLVDKSPPTWEEEFGSLMKKSCWSWRSCLTLGSPNSLLRPQWRGVGGGAKEE